jgi:hypothetical protein
LETKEYEWGMGQLGIGQENNLTPSRKGRKEEYI